MQLFLLREVDVIAGHTLVPLLDTERLGTAALGNGALTLLEGLASGLRGNRSVLAETGSAQTYVKNSLQAADDDMVDRWRVPAPLRATPGKSRDMRWHPQGVHRRCLRRLGAARMPCAVPT